MSTHITFGMEDNINNFKLNSKKILEELDSAQEQPKSLESKPMVPLILSHIQKRKNVSKVNKYIQNQ